MGAMCGKPTIDFEQHVPGTRAEIKGDLLLL
jgi:hypothetical protein